MKDIAYLSVFILSLLGSTSSFCQGLYPVSHDEKISRASHIIEGKVISGKSYWNPAHTMIFTASDVEVYKLFKGNLAKDTVEIITVGGAVGNYAIHASHLLALHTGDLGLFFCEKSRGNTRVPLEGRESFDVYSSSQGFLQYDLISKTATAPFSRFADIETVLYPNLQTKTGRSLKIRNPSFSIEKARIEKGIRISSNSTLAPVITSFSPAVVNAGALQDEATNVLTIIGTGFGTPSGSAAVQFDNADDGRDAGFTTIRHDSSLIISWTATTIRVKVPSNAGTGNFRVVDNAGVSVNSPSFLNVNYSILTFGFSDAIGGPREINLINANTTGGYTIRYSTSTANNGININTSPAKGSFQRAMNTWVENAGANFLEGGTGSTQVVDTDDDNNMVMFDNSATGLSGPLATGVLATCFSGINLCNDLPESAFKPGFDIVIRNQGYSLGNIPFTIGPCPPYGASEPQVDLESVLLHELGHALSLGHIIDGPEGTGAGNINPAKVMHYSVAYNLRRISLDASASNGAAYMINPKGSVYGNCLPASPQMVPSTAVVVETKDECPASFPVAVTPVLTTVHFDLAHAGSNKGVDPGFDQMYPTVTGASVTNTVYYPFRTNSTGGDLSLEVTDYLTLPGAVASCVPGANAIPVTGVHLALYRVNSCPAAGSYPLPVVSRSFANNGIITPITGLTANSTYLLVLDGVENTKVDFNMIFSGSSLSPRFGVLGGEIFASYNFLQWTTGISGAESTLFLERSPDGVTFEQIAEFTTPADLEGGEFSDSEPLPGNNYYRLSLRNADGSVEYSETVLLSRTETKVYPNPATNMLTVRFNNSTPGNYLLIMYNAMGQKVIERRVVISQVLQLETFSVGGLARGMYRIVALDTGNNRVITSSVVLR